MDVNILLTVGTFSLNKLIMRGCGVGVSGADKIV